MVTQLLATEKLLSNSSQTSLNILSSHFNLRPNHMSNSFGSIKQKPQKYRIDLINHLSIILIVVTLIFWIITLTIITNVSQYIFVVLLTVALIIIGLNRKGYHTVAAFFGLITFNLIIYAIASSEPSQTGSHMYLGCAAFAALVLFGYEQRYVGFLFLLFSVALFFACHFSNYSPLTERHFTQEETQLFFIINSISFIIICVYMFYLVLRLNYTSETALKENEERINNQNLQLIKTNEELDRFVYSASHDLRAPLSSISGLITVATASEAMEEVKNYLTMMKGRVGVLDKFITDIIHYARNTRMEVMLEKINLHHLVQETIDGLKFMEGVELIDFRVNVEPTAELNTDPTRLRMVLNNVISNAIRYHDKSKEQRHIEIKVQRNENELSIMIGDNGLGIANEHQEKLFNMFYKASANGSGSGLGLYIAREATLKLGGAISVNSIAGKGSTFTINLPVS